MLDSINPFNDPILRDEILGKEGRLGKDISEYELLEPEEVVSQELNGIISRAPKIPSGVKNVIYDASAIAKNEKEAKASEITLALNDVFTSYNKEYGTNLQIDFSSFSQTLVNVSDPKSRHTLELYLSEVFQSIRPVLILHMISKLSLAIEYILDPQRMLGGEMTLQDTFIAVEKIMQFIQQLEDMKRDIIIVGSDLELKKMSTDSEDFDNIESKKVIDDFMKFFKAENGLPE